MIFASLGDCPETRCRGYRWPSGDRLLPSEQFQCNKFISMQINVCSPAAPSADRPLLDRSPNVHVLIYKSLARKTMKLAFIYVLTSDNFNAPGFAAPQRAARAAAADDIERILQRDR